MQCRSQRLGCGSTCLLATAPLLEPSYFVCVGSNYTMGSRTLRFREVGFWLCLFHSFPCFELSCFVPLFAAECPQGIPACADWAVRLCVRTMY